MAREKQKSPKAKKLPQRKQRNGYGSGRRSDASDAESLCSGDGSARTSVTDSSSATGATSSSTAATRRKGGKKSKVAESGNRDLGGGSTILDVIDILLDTKPGKAGRVATLLKLKSHFDSKPQCSVVESHCDSLISALLPSISRGSAEESRIACDCVKAVVLTKGEGELGGSLFDDIVGCLRRAAKSGSSSAVRGAAAETYGYVASVGCDDDEKHEEAEEWFIQQANDPKWSAVYTRRPGERAKSTFDQDCEALGFCASYKRGDVQSADSFGDLSAEAAELAAAMKRVQSQLSPNGISPLSRIEILAAEADGMLRGWLLLATRWPVTTLADYNQRPASELWYFASQCVLYVAKASTVNPSFLYLRLTAGIAVGLILESLWRVRGALQRVDYHPDRQLKMKAAVVAETGDLICDDDDDDESQEIDEGSDAWSSAAMTPCSGRGDAAKATDSQGLLRVTPPAMHGDDEFLSSPDSDKTQLFAAYEVETRLGAVLERLRDLVGKPQHGLSRGDKRELTTSFRDVLRTAETGESPRVKFGVSAKYKTTTLIGWSATYRYKMLREVFQGSTALHLESDSPALFLVFSGRDSAEGNWRRSPNDPQWNSVLEEDHSLTADVTRKKTTKARQSGRQWQRRRKMSAQNWNENEV